MVRYRSVRGTAIGLAALVVAGFWQAGPLHSNSPWYGKPDDVELAKSLWAALRDARMVGPDRINVHAFEGKQPHAKIQQVWAGDVLVKGRRARAVVKANHAKTGATVANVYDSPEKYLSAYTVMFQNVTGYDPRNGDWFWVKYNPAGGIDKDRNGVAIAGRVDSPSGFGCAACHRKTGGKDLEALTSR